jgi:hypothetical protein
VPPVKLYYWKYSGDIRPQIISTRAAYDPRVGQPCTTIWTRAICLPFYNLIWNYLLKGWRYDRYWLTGWPDRKKNSYDTIVPEHVGVWEFTN